MKSLLLFSFLLMPLSALAVPITVRVTDEAGAPIEGATVEVNRFDEVKPALVVETTDAQGLARYDLGGAAFDANFFGQAVVWKAGHALSGAFLRGLKDGALVLKLGASTTISGTIMDANGPVEGATVQIKQVVIRRPETGNQLLQLNANSALAQKMGVRSDAQGRFTLEGVPAATQLELRVSGATYATQIARAQSGGAVAVTLQPGAALGGIVTGLDGAPLTDLAVYAQKRGDSGEIAADVTTGADGAYRFSGLEAGTYNILFRPARADEWVVAAREGVVAVAGEARELESARAVAGVVVRGRVINAQSRAGIANLGIEIYGPTQPKSGGAIAPVATDKDGNFSARVAPGANMVAFGYLPREWAPPEQQFALDTGADAVAPLIIELAPAVPLRGRIVDEDGNGVQTKLAITQNRNERPLESDENGDFEIYGLTKGEATIGRSMFGYLNEDAPEEWEIAKEQKVDLPATGPLKVVVRRTQLNALTGRAQDETGAPIAGVQLKVSVANGEGVGSTSQWKTVVSDAQGLFNLPSVRAGEIVKLNGIEKTGYDLQSGGEISRDGLNWKVTTVVMLGRKNQIAGRITLADGAPAKGAQIFAAGSETRADANGVYTLKVLPTGDVDVLVYSAGQFGFVSAQTTAPNEVSTSTDLKLAPQMPQPIDRELASEIMARARVLAAQGNPDRAGRLKLSDADPVGSLEALIAAPVNADQMSMAVYLRTGNPEVPTELLLRAARAIADPNWRLTAATMLSFKRPDWPDDEETRAFVASLISDADEIAAAKNGDKNWLTTMNLLGIAPLIERYRGDEAGRAALARGIAWVKARDPQPGNGNTDGYLATFAAVAEPVAAGSPELFAQLVAEIDQTSSAYPRAMEEGIVAISKARGLEAAQPFLRQLGAAPNPDRDGPGGGLNYTARRATRAAIAAGGASAPALALQLARELGVNDNDYEDEGARALAEAAFFQAPDVAAPLWKQALPKLTADRAAQIAVRVIQTQPALGAELLESARQKLAAADEVNSWGNSIVASFAFYEARADASAAHYRLEKEWWGLQGKSDDFRIKPDLVRAMSSIDGERAFEWASLLPPGDPQYGDNRVDALRDAALYIEASERARARVDFERWKRDSTIFMD